MKHFIKHKSGCQMPIFYHHEDSGGYLSLYANIYMSNEWNEEPPRAIVSIIFSDMGEMVHVLKMDFELDTAERIINFFKDKENYSTLSVSNPNSFASKADGVNNPAEMLR